MAIIDEALEYFNYGVTHDIFKPPVTIHANLAIVALEKMKATPIKRGKAFWRNKYHCPCCSAQLYRTGMNYCDCCGQKLDWSRYEEVLKDVK